MPLEKQNPATASRPTRLFVVIAITLFLAGCGIFPKPQDETAGWSANKLYSEATAAVNAGEYEKAIEYFEKLEARYPYGRYAEQAQLEIAYAYYKYSEPESALAAADRFIKLHPRHPNVDYAYYLKGLVNFNRGRGIIQKIIPRDDAQRDIEAARQAFFDFRKLVDQFPQSRYAADARSRMRYLRNVMARHEIYVAQFYMKRKAYVAAVNRAKHVLNEYPETPSIPEALGLMADAYGAMGLEELEQDAQRVLLANYPEHPAAARGNDSN